MTAPLSSFSPNSSADNISRLDSSEVQGNNKTMSPRTKKALIITGLAVAVIAGLALTIAGGVLLGTGAGAAIAIPLLATGVSLLAAGLVASALVAAKAKGLIGKKTDTPVPLSLSPPPRPSYRPHVPGAGRDVAPERPSYRPYVPQAGSKAPPPPVPNFRPKRSSL